MSRVAYFLELSVAQLAMVMLVEIILVVFIKFIGEVCILSQITEHTRLSPIEIHALISKAFANLLGKALRSHPRVLILDELATSGNY